MIPIAPWSVLADTPSTLGFGPWPGSFPSGPLYLCGRFRENRAACKRSRLNVRRVCRARRFADYGPERDTHADTARSDGSRTHPRRARPRRAAAAGGRTVPRARRLLDVARPGRPGHHRRHLARRTCPSASSRSTPAGCSRRRWPSSTPPARSTAGGWRCSSPTPRRSRPSSDHGAPQLPRVGRGAQGLLRPAQGAAAPARPAGRGRLDHRPAPRAVAKPARRMRIIEWDASYELLKVNPLDRLVHDAMRRLPGGARRA